MNYTARFLEVNEYHNEVMERVRTTPEPKNQKFPCGSRVMIVDDLGPNMSYFTSGVGATVIYVYAHAYGGNDVESYCLDVDGEGKVSWYYESQLSLENKMIKHCKCRHKFQDKRYGQGERVHNKVVNKTTGKDEWICTVCENRKCENRK